MKYSGAIIYAVALAAVAFVGVNVFGWTFFTSCVIAFISLLGYLIVTRVKIIIRVNPPVSPDIKLSDITSLMLPRYFWHGVEGSILYYDIGRG